MKLIGLIAILSMTVMSSSSLLANDYSAEFAQADALYAQRGNNDRATIGQAREIYDNILKNSSDEAIKIRAATQLGRLAIYEGMMMDTTKAEREALFKQCWDKQMRLIENSTHPAYTVFAGYCMANWGKAAGPIRSLPKINFLIDTINKGLERDRRFEMGGILRLAAGTYVSRTGKAVGLYKPQEALTLINEAIAHDAYPGQSVSGSEYLDNYRVKAQALVELGRAGEAMTLLSDTIDLGYELEDLGALPEGKEPEIIWSLGEMERYLESLSQ